MNGRCMNKIIHIIARRRHLQVTMIKASKYKITIGVCSYLVVRARNEKLAQHLLSPVYPDPKLPLEPAWFAVLVFGAVIFSVKYFGGY